MRTISDLLRSRDYFVYFYEDYLQKFPLDHTAQEKAEIRTFIRAAKESKIVLFDADQLEVFWNLISRDRFIPDVDYRLPFQSIWIQFNREINILEVEDPTGPDNVALLLTQNEEEDRATNAVVSIGESVDIEYVIWTNHDSEQMRIKTWEYEGCIENASKYRLLAAACVQYINCENVYLESVGGAPEKVNRKREAKGKRRLEPYYVCRIRGVSYDKSDTSGTGSKHGIRYDVRGHFRRLEGKTIWVRAHQRGLANELYIPKVYKVDRVTPPPVASSTPD